MLFLGCEMMDDDCMLEDVFGTRDFLFGLKILVK